MFKTKQIAGSYLIDNLLILSLCFGINGFIRLLQFHDHFSTDGILFYLFFFLLTLISYILWREKENRKYQKSIILTVGFVTILSGFMPRLLSHNSSFLYIPSSIATLLLIIILGGSTIYSSTLVDKAGYIVRKHSWFIVLIIIGLISISSFLLKDFFLGLMDVVRLGMLYSWDFLLNNFFLGFMDVARLDIVRFGALYLGSFLITLGSLLLIIGLGIGIIIFFVTRLLRKKK